MYYKTKKLDIDFENLPEEAIKELYNFYEYIIYKYGREKKVNLNEIMKNIDKLSWQMGEKLYKTRDELHER